MTKKVKNVMELFRNYFNKGFIQKEEKRKERKKDETLFEVDTFITAMCIERDGMLYVFYRQQII
jgi:hypothetical protein